MACGIPCVVTDVGDSAWIVRDTGVVIPPRNPQKLAEGWQQVIELSNEERELLGNKARQRIIDHFSLDSVVNQYENLYQSVYQKKA
jgi:glycosyltransferase involved in cell wall biosynthesis